MSKLLYKGSIIKKDVIPHLQDAKTQVSAIQHLASAMPNTASGSVNASVSSLKTMIGDVADGINDLLTWLGNSEKTYKAYETEMKFQLKELPKQEIKLRVSPINTKTN